MKTVITLLILTASFTTWAQSKQEKQVATAVTHLKEAMVNADSLQLDILTADYLSYGHSSGAIDDKSVFMQKILSGTSDFVTITLTEQTILISQKTAIVRHRLDAITNDNGKSGEVHLKVMQVWQKQRGGWKLLGRQAVKIV